jgi:hypothetical protein
MATVFRNAIYQGCIAMNRLIECGSARKRFRSTFTLVPSDSATRIISRFPDERILTEYERWLFFGRFKVFGSYFKVSMLEPIR